MLRDHIRGKPHIVCLMRLRGGPQSSSRQTCPPPPHIVCLMRLRGGPGTHLSHLLGLASHSVPYATQRRRNEASNPPDQEASHSVPYATQRRKSSAINLILARLPHIVCLMRLRGGVYDTHEDPPIKQASHSVPYATQRRFWFTW